MKNTKISMVEGATSGARTNRKALCGTNAVVSLSTVPVDEGHEGTAISSTITSHMNGVTTVVRGTNAASKNPTTPHGPNMMRKAAMVGISVRPTAEITALATPAANSIDPEDVDEP